MQLRLALQSAVVDQYTKGEWALMAYMKTGDISAHDLKKNVDQLTLKHKGNRYTLMMSSPLCVKSRAARLK